MNKRRLIITSTISIFLVAILLIGSTYSIFTSSEVDESANVYTTGVLDITYTLSEDNIALTDSVPMGDGDSCELKPYRITVTNNGTVPYMFDVILNDTTASNVIDYQYISIQVGQLDPKLLSETTNNIIKEDVVVPAKSSVDIDVRAWISDTVQNSEIGKSFYAKLSIDGLAVYDDREEINNDKLRADMCVFNYDATIAYNLNYQLNDMNGWTINNGYDDRFTIEYDAITNMNTVSVAGTGGWEIIYMPINTVVGESYTVSFDYEIPADYRPLTNYSGVAYQILNLIIDYHNYDNALVTDQLPNLATLKKQTVTMSFTATKDITYFAFNFGMGGDGETTTLKLGNFKLIRNTIKNDSANDVDTNYNMNDWSIGSGYDDRFTIEYDADTNMNTVSVVGDTAWEIIYLPINTIVGETYRITFDYEIPADYSVWTTYPGLGYQLLNQIYNNSNVDNALVTQYLPKTTTLSKETASVTFTATASTTYLAFNFGMTVDYETTTVKLGNFKISRNALSGITRVGYDFNGWYTEPDGGNLVDNNTKFFENESYLLYASWAANSYFDQEYTLNFNGNMFNVASQTSNGVTITYDEDNSYLTLNGTVDTSYFRLMLFDGLSFTEGDQYKITLTYLSGSYTYSASDNSYCFATEIKKDSSATALSTRNNADTKFPTSGSYSNTLTVSSIGASEGTTLYVWIWSNTANSLVFSNYKIKVNITKVSTKQVVTGNLIGDLPTPVRYNKTFSGWYTEDNGGYLVNYNSILNSNGDYTLYARYN